MLQHTTAYAVAHYCSISVPPNSISSSSYAQDGITYRSLETKSRANMAAMAKICNPVLHERIHFFKWKLDWCFAISYAIQNTFLAIFKKLHCWVVGSYVVFRLPVSCAQFHCSSTFLHGIRQIPARFIKTVMFSCQNDSFMLFSWMWRIALDKHYNSILCCHAGMTKSTLGCSITEQLEQCIVNLLSTTSYYTENHVKHSGQSKPAFRITGG